ncbi:MAG: pilus assembly protein PilM [Syntrophaceae bacterium]|nr:pilus assembly protein PilM [Syntrophaceae bacterium]
MTQSGEISSTEKLLKVIRKQSSELPEISSIQPGTSTRSNFKFPSINPLQKSITLGVDIGQTNIRLVKTKKLSDNKWKVIEYIDVPYSPSILNDTQAFENLLKSELQRFCGSEQKINVWANMSAANVEVRHIRIPKVPKKQIENAVYWTFKKESPFDDKEDIFDFEIQDEVIERGVHKYSVMVYAAPRKEIEDIKRLFARINIPLTGISITPFAIQNIFRAHWIEIPGKTVANLFIGNDFSRIDIFSNGNLVMTRGIKAGTNSMIEALSEVISVPRPMDVNDNGGTTISRDRARKILMSLSSDSQPLTKSDAGYGLKEKDIFDIILPALDRLVRQIERTFEYFTVNLGNEKINKIYISGVMGIYIPLVDYIGNQLGIDREILDPLGAQGATKIQSGIDTKGINISARSAFVPALGLALSDNLHTPNLSFTYKDKEKASIVVLINRVILAGFIAFALICSVIIVYQSNSISNKRAVINGLEKQMSQYDPGIDRNRILLLVEQNKKEQQLTKLYAERYTGMAAISELSSLTPQYIRIIDLKIVLGSKSSGKKNVTQKTTTSKVSEAMDEFGTLVLEGIVNGDKMERESLLAGYIQKLNSSPMFHRISVQRGTIISLKTGDVLQFTLNVKLG